ncbi:MAG: hypothetical protein HQK96_18730 [Nitrospirae bacterium]|nr:hypothetical protein [Nitrospirota bacterium]
MSKVGINIFGNNKIVVAGNSRVFIQETPEDVTVTCICPICGDISYEELPNVWGVDDDVTIPFVCEICKKRMVALLKNMKTMSARNKATRSIYKDLADLMVDEINHGNEKAAAFWCKHLTSD